MKFFSFHESENDQIHSLKSNVNIQKNIFDIPENEMVAIVQTDSASIPKKNNKAEDQNSVTVFYPRIKKTFWRSNFSYAFSGLDVDKYNFDAMVLPAKYLQYASEINALSSLQKFLSVLKKIGLKFEFIATKNEPDKTVLPSWKHSFKNWTQWNFISPFKELRNKKTKKYHSFSQPLQRLSFSLISVLLLFYLIGASIDFPISGDEQIDRVASTEAVKYYMEGSDKLFNIKGHPELPYYPRINLVVISFVDYFFEIEYFEWLHILNAIMGFLLILYAARIGKLFGGYNAAFLTIILMLLSQRVLGHIINNSKDAPFALGYVVSIFYTLRMFRNFPNIVSVQILPLIFSIAFTLLIRIGGLLIYFYWLMFMGLTFIHHYRLKNIFNFRIYEKTLIRYLKAFFFWVLFSWLLTIIFWPVSHKNPLTVFKETLDFFANFFISIRVSFEGDTYMSSNLPHNYVIKFMLFTAPISVLMGAVLFPLAFRLIKQKTVSLFFILFAFIFPVFYVVFKESNLYGGMRHFIFAFCFLIIFSAICWSQVLLLLNKKGLKILFFCMIPLLSFSAIRHHFVNKPYHYVYYNELTGGVSGAYGQFDIDYYYASLKEGIEYLIENGHINQTDSVTVATNHNAIASEYLKHYKNVRLIYTNYGNRMLEEWDFGVYVNIYISPKMLREGVFPDKENLLHAVEVDGKPICAVYKKRVYEALLAKKAIESQQVNAAVKHLKKSVESFPGHYFSLHHLKSIYFKSGKINEGILYLDQALEYQAPVAQLWIEKYQIQKQMKQDYKALNTLKKALKFHRRNPQMYYYISSEYMGVKNYRKYVEHAEKGLKYYQSNDKTPFYDILEKGYSALKQQKKANYYRNLKTKK